ncbi:uncharacterized protein V6R79_002676 [Siganus canaliculatus]
MYCMDSKCLEWHRNTYKMWLWIFTGVGIISSVLGYSDGIFPHVCRSMSPRHNSFVSQGPPQTAPYNLTYVYGQKGEPVTVTLQSKEPSTFFRGFMLEARQIGKEDPVGSFTLLDPSNTRILTCTDVAGFAVSQRNNVKKYSIRVNWTADVLDQDITFRATVLNSFTTFWEGVEVNVSFTDPPETSAQATTTTSTTSTATTVPSTTSTTETHATSTASTTMPSTTSTTETHATSTASTTMPSTTSTTEPSTTSTTEPSTTSTTKSSTTSTTEPSTSGTTLSSTTSTASMTESSTTGTTLSSTTSTASMTESSTTSTMEPSTTGTTHSPLGSSTGSTSPSPTPEPLPFWKKVATALVVLDTLFLVMKMELVSIMFQRQIKISASLCSLLSMAAELLALVLFCLDGPTIKIIALVCAVIVVNFTEVLIITQSFGTDHNKFRKEIATQLCSVVHISFSIALIFVVLLESGCPLPLIVMIAYTVWLFLFVIWIFSISTRRKVKPARHRIEYSNNNATSRHRREKKTFTLAKVTIIAVSLFFIVGTMAFTAAVIFLEFSPNQD